MTYNFPRIDDSPGDGLMVLNSGTHAYSAAMTMGTGSPANDTGVYLTRFSPSRTITVASANIYWGGNNTNTPTARVITAVNTTGSSYTYNFSGSSTYAVGESVTIVGVSPSYYQGTFTVTASGNLAGTYYITVTGTNSSPAAATLSTPRAYSDSSSRLVIYDSTGTSRLAYGGRTSFSSVSQAVTNNTTTLGNINSSLTQTDTTGGRDPNLAGSGSNYTLYADTTYLIGCYLSANATTASYLGNINSNLFGSTLATADGWFSASAGQGSTTNYPSSVSTGSTVRYCPQIALVSA